MISPATTGVSSILWLGPGTPAGAASPRLVKRLRVVTTANTNVTYRAEVHQHVL